MLVKLLKKLSSISEFVSRNGLKSFLELKKKNIHYSRYELFNKSWLKELNVKTVLDIGANIGEFSLIFDQIFDKPKIYAFEPLPECIKKLNDISKNYKNLKVKPFALGNSNSKEIIYVSSWAPSSSLLKMGELHKKAAPHSAGSEEIVINVKKLDDVLSPSVIENNLLIKIDVQGFERNVILGGKNIFKLAKVIIIEMSFDELYDQEPRFGELYNELIDLGFEYKGSLKQSVSRIDDSFLQCDGIFINKFIN